MMVYRRFRVGDEVNWVPAEGAKPIRALIERNAVVEGLRSLEDREPRYVVKRLDNGKTFTAPESKFRKPT